eukprot:4147933-Alexandrium_andersonii.AAC.1
MAGHPEPPPGLDPDAPGQKRTRAASAGASPSAISTPLTSTTSAPTALGPPGSVGVSPRTPRSEAARISERAPGEAAWQESL